MSMRIKIANRRLSYNTDERVGYAESLIVDEHWKKLGLETNTKNKLKVTKDERRSDKKQYR